MYQAVQALGAVLDEVPMCGAYTIQVVVYARPDSVEPGAIILGQSQNCARIGCPVIFVFREVTEWKFVKPVFIGDTIHVVMEVVEMKELRRLGVGSVIISMSVLNQNDEVVMKGVWNILIALRPNS